MTPYIYLLKGHGSANGRQTIESGVKLHVSSTRKFYVHF